MSRGRGVVVELREGMKINDFPSFPASAVVVFKGWSWSVGLLVRVGGL